MWHTLVHHHAFRRLWIAATVNACGSWLLVIAVPVHVYALTGSATSTSLALAIEALPAVLIAPWAGVATDRLPRGTVLVAANVASAAGVALMLAASTPGRVAFVYLGLLVENGALCFLRPALQAATPVVVTDESTLASANALLATSNSVWRISGPLVGTYLAAIGWFPAVVLLDLVSYLVAAAIISSVPIPATGRSENSSTRVRDQLREGLRHIAGTGTLRGLLASSWLYWTANGALTALLVPFVTHRLHASGSAVGYLITGLGVGYLCGSVLSKKALGRLSARSAITVGYAAVGLCFLVMFTATSLPIAIAAATGSGLPGATALVATGHHLQISTPNQIRGRVSAAFQTSDAIAAVVGALAAPAVVALADLSRGVVALSATVLVAAAVAAILIPGPAHPDSRSAKNFPRVPSNGVALVRRVGSGHARRHQRKETDMSFQAYLDTIEDKTGKTPRQLLALAAEQGFEGPTVKAGAVIDWLKTEYGLGRGHAMALVHVIKNGPKISTKHVGAAGTHRDESDTLWLDGKATRPA